mgnify:FL=1
MIYDTTITMGRYWHLKDWWKLIVGTFREYLDHNVKLFNDKEIELSQRYAACQDESDYANIAMEEKEVYNSWLLRSVLNAGLMYLYSQFERKMVELAQIVSPGYDPPYGGVIESACEAIRSAKGLELSSLWIGSWGCIKDFLQIRNACVHRDGVTDELRHIEAIHRLNQFLKVIDRPDGNMEIYLTKENLIWISDKMTYCYELLIDELEKYEKKKEES